MKIVTIIGARPQFIKAAVVSRSFKSFPKINEVIIHTGQHYDNNMSKIFFDELDIQAADYNLKVGGGSHGQNTGRMIERIEAVLIKEEPDYVLVYGDTDSTLAGALAATKLHIPIGHIEAGLRSFDKRMPEEINRLITDHVSNTLFVPTSTAITNLNNEGIVDGIHQVGDVMFDAALFFGKKAKKSSTILSKLTLASKSYCLATVHRQENTDDEIRLKGILAGFAKSKEKIILPLHPRTKRKVRDLGFAMPPNITVIDPVGYLDMVTLEMNSRIILTDSGGVQKEAFFHKIPCITLRDQTEWIELLEVGANVLVGADTDSIVSEILKLSASNDEFITPSDSLIYGDGTAGETIARFFSYG